MPGLFSTPTILQAFDPLYQGDHSDMPAAAPSLDLSEFDPLYNNAILKKSPPATVTSEEEFTSFYSHVPATMTPKINTINQGTIKDNVLEAFDPLYLPPSPKDKNITISAEIYLQPLLIILEYAKKNKLTPKLMILDIDHTLLSHDPTKPLDESFSLKCPDAWKKRMNKERENDPVNRTITIWGIGTFRRREGGLYEKGCTFRKEIQLLFKEYAEFINLHLVTATGVPGGSPGCKVKNILDGYHKNFGIPKKDIVIFDDNFLNVTMPALANGFNALPVSPKSEQTAAAVIEHWQPHNGSMVSTASHFQSEPLIRHHSVPAPAAAPADVRTTKTLVYRRE